MKKKFAFYSKIVMFSAIIISAIVVLSGCRGLFDNKKSDGLSRRGLQYYFDNQIYNTVTIDMLDSFEFNAPSMEGIIKDNLRIYSGDNNALVLWFDKAKNDMSLGKIINKYSETMVENIEEVADIDNVGVELDLKLLANDTVNNINRNKYKGTINAIGRDGIDVELNTVIYTLKVGKRPGYIMGIVTNRAQEKDEFVEIETNAQILANTIKQK